MNSIGAAFLRADVLFGVNYMRDNIERVQRRAARFLKSRYA